MSDLIVHQYDMSPFSEKVRAMLGYAQLPWQAVTTRQMPPRPHLDEVLVGGYRKIPVAQQGADVFCDSRVISAEIARLSEKPLLALENCSAEINDFVQRTDLDVFFACILSANSKALARKAWASSSLADLLKLLWDRAKMGRTASVSVVGPRQARPMVEAHLQQIEAMLKDDFLFGAVPTNADFAAYHGLWFIRDLAERSFVAKYPRVMAWLDRIKAFGHGMRRDIGIEGSIQIARDARPRAIADCDRQDARIGSLVSVAPSDYGQKPTVGTLVGASAHRWVIAREHPQVGVVHVHFPVPGFSLQKAP
ncbi:Conserved hypothetical protein [gamma proteobacterium HdN1]|nr:Conserved hypothetical protein [gamma proteobacterium HdN1]